MSDAARVEVIGADRCASTLRAAGRELAEPTAALDDSGRLVEQRARAFAPVRTGALARSISASRSGSEVTVGPHVGVYAAVQEYGSVTTPAHPYLRPAADYSAVLIVGYVARDADRALAQVKGA